MPGHNIEWRVILGKSDKKVVESSNNIQSNSNNGKINSIDPYTVIIASWGRA